MTQKMIRVTECERPGCISSVEETVPRDAALPTGWAVVSLGVDRGPSPELEGVVACPACAQDIHRLWCTRPTVAGRTSRLACDGAAEERPVPVAEAHLAC